MKIPLWERGVLDKKNHTKYFLHWRLKPPSDGHNYGGACAKTRQKIMHFCLVQEKSLVASWESGKSWPVGWKFSRQNLREALGD